MSARTLAQRLGIATGCALLLLGCGPVSDCKPIRYEPGGAFVLVHWGECPGQDGYEYCNGRKRCSRYECELLDPNDCSGLPDVGVDASDARVDAQVDAFIDAAMSDAGPNGDVDADRDE